MTAKELMIGNLISRRDLFDNHKRIEKVIKIGEKLLTTGPINVNCEYNNIYPIPLTEEWLIKFGATKANIRPCYVEFDNEDDESDFWAKKYDFDGVYLEGFTLFKIKDILIGEKDGEWFFVEEKIAADESVYIGSISSPIKFVHTFQNYYPAFSREELKIK